MTISERLFRIMEEKNISMSELSRLTGISRHMIFDWHKKNTNPGSDKIMAICRALEITPEQLLTGEGIDDVTEFKPITEQGIYMLATVLKEDLAEQQSIYIMRAFKEMRHYIRRNQQFVKQIWMTDCTVHMIRWIRWRT